MKVIQMSLALAVFFVSCWMGFSIARQKPLWTDEIFSEGIDVRSGYWDILTSRNLNEGNKAPVYYFLQKWIERAFSYQLPENTESLSLYKDKKAQWVCRINSVIWMSLSIAMIFYFFTRTTSFWAGGCALLITLSTYMVWAYWAEDRIYAFWFFLTSLQCLSVLWSCQNDLRKSALRGWLMVTNILFSLTTILSIIQIAAVSVWMYFSGNRKIKDYLLVSVIPMAICLFYYTRAAHYAFVFVMPAWKLITANIPWERVALVLAGVLYLWKNRDLRLSPKDGKGLWSYLSYLGLVFVAGAGLILLFKATGNTSSVKQRCVLDARHFIFLAPLGIIALTYIFIRLLQVSRTLMFRGVLVLLLFIVTIPRIWRYAHFSYVTGGPVRTGQSLR